MSIKRRFFECCETISCAVLVALCCAGVAPLVRYVILNWDLLNGLDTVEAVTMRIKTTTLMYNALFYTGVAWMQFGVFRLLKHLTIKPTKEEIAS